MTFFIRLLSKIFGNRPKELAKPLSWPRHLFVAVDSLGLTYGGEVSNSQEMTAAAQALVSFVCFEQKQMLVARYWTTERDDFSHDEEQAYLLNKTEVR